MRRPILTANWKLHKTGAEAVSFVDEFLPRIATVRDVEIVLAVPFTILDRVGQRLKGSAVQLAAQNAAVFSAGRSRPTVTNAMTSATATTIGIARSSSSTRLGYCPTCTETVTLLLRKSLPL